MAFPSYPDQREAAGQLAKALASWSPVRCWDSVRPRSAQELFQEAAELLQRAQKLLEQARTMHELATAGQK